MIITPIFQEIYLYLTKDNVLFLYPDLLFKNKTNKEKKKTVDKDKLQYIPAMSCTPGSQLKISFSFSSISMHIFSKYILSIWEEKVPHTKVFNDTYMPLIVLAYPVSIIKAFIFKMLGGGNSKLTTYCSLF